MTLKQLEAFYWAATSESFLAAARHLHLTVSSLSKRVGELESFLDCTLFDRSGRKATLTPKGEQLLAGAHAMLRASAELQHSMTAPRGLMGRCRIGVSELCALTWLPDLIARVGAEHPELLLEAHVYFGQELEERLEKGELDWIVISGPSTRGTLAAEAVARAEFSWVASAGLVERSGRDLQQLFQREMLVSLPDGAGTTRLLDQWLAGHVAAVGRRLRCNNWSAIVGIIMQGAGFGFMPKAWAEAMAGRNQLEILAADSTQALCLDYVVQWRRADMRPMIGEMRKLVKATIGFPAPLSLA